MKKNAAILLDEPSLPALHSAIAQITELASFIGSIDSRLGTMAAHHDEFTAAIQQIEDAADYQDASAVTAIHTKRGQLELLGRQAARLKLSIQPKTEELRVAIDGLNNLLPRLVKPAQNALHSELVASLRPIFGHDPVRLKHEAMDAPQAVSFREFFLREWATSNTRDSVLARAAQVLAMLETLARGENPWVFVPPADQTMATQARETVFG